MKGQYLRPSELLKLLKETGLSYWDIIGNPLPTFDSGVDDVEALSPHPYTAKLIEILLPFERFDNGKEYFAGTLPEVEVVAPKIKESVEDAIAEREHRNALRGALLRSIFDNSLDPPKQKRITIQPEDEWEGIYMYKKGKSRDELFAEKLGPLVSAGLRKRGFNTRTTYDNVMRLLAHESAAGTSNIARNQHNYGGYGYNGKTYSSFPSDLAFVDAYLDTMASRYKSALLATDTASYAKALRAKGYYTASEDEYARALANWGKLSKIAAQYYIPENAVTLNALTEEPDNTRVDKPTIVVNRLRRPSALKELPFVVEEEPVSLTDIDVPYQPSSILPNPIGYFNQMFGADLPTFEHGKSGIHIKPSHRGRFTRYLKAHPGMTAEKAKHSKNPHVRKMATFAINARHFKH